MPYGKHHGKPGRPQRRGRVFRDSTERRRITAYYNNRHRGRLSLAVDGNEYEDQQEGSKAELSTLQEYQDADIVDVDALPESEPSQSLQKLSVESVSKSAGAGIFDKIKEKEVRIVMKRITQDAIECPHPKTQDAIEYTQKSLKSPVPKRLKFMVPKVSKRNGLTRLDSVVPKIMNCTVPTRLKSPVSNVLRPTEKRLQLTVSKSSPSTEPTEPGSTPKRVLFLVHLKQPISVASATNSQPETTTSQTIESNLEGSSLKSLGPVAPKLPEMNSTGSTSKSVTSTSISQDLNSVGLPSSTSILSKHQSIASKNGKRKRGQSSKAQRERRLKELKRRCLTITSNVQPESSHLQSVENLSNVSISKSPGSVTAVTNPSQVINHTVSVSGGFNHKTPSTTSCDDLRSINLSSAPTKEPNSTLLQPNNYEKNNFSPNLNSSTSTELPSMKHRAPTNGLMHLLHLLKNPLKSVKVSLPRISVPKSIELTRRISPTNMQLSSTSSETASVTEVVGANLGTKRISMQEHDSNSSNSNSAEPLPDTSGASRCISSKVVEAVKGGKASNMNTSYVNRQSDTEQSLVTTEKFGKVINGHSQRSHLLLCRSVRIGSYKIHPAGDSSDVSVDVTPDSFFFQVPSAKTPFDLVPITLKTPDIVEVLGYFGPHLPVIFMITTSECAASIRDQLGMVTRGPIYFDPNSKDEKQKIITFLIGAMNKELKKYLCRSFPGNILKQIKQKEANEILLKCTPKQNKLIETKSKEQKCYNEKEPPISQEEEPEEKPDYVKSLGDNSSISTVSGDEMSFVENSVFLCTFCMKRFDDCLEYKKHMEIHSDKDCICQVCNKGFAREHDLQVHIAECQVNQNSFVCSVCLMEFSRKCDLSQHVKFHYSKTPFECEICKLSFTQQKALASHAYQSHNESLYQCNICKTFRFKYSHLQHMSSHSKAKSYVCKTCNQVFTKHLLLKSHIHQIHKKKRLLHCSECQKVFFQVRRLQKHLRKKHPYRHKSKKAACSVSKSSPSSSIAQQKPEKSVSTLVSRRRKNSACSPQKLNTGMQVRRKYQKQEQNKVSSQQLTAEAQVRRTSQRHKKKQVSPQQLTVGTQVRRTYQRKKTKPVSPQQLTVVKVRKTYERLKKKQVSPQQLTVGAQVQRTFQRQKRKQVDGVAATNVEPESNRSKTLETVLDQYVLKSLKSAAAAVTNFPEVTEAATPVATEPAESSRSANCTTLAAVHPSWLRRTCTKVSSKKDTSLRVCKTYSKADRSCTEESRVDSHAIRSCTEKSRVDSHVIRSCTEASKVDSHIIKSCTEASRVDSHAIGSCTEASKVASHAISFCTEASRVDSHATRSCTEASRVDSHIIRPCIEASRVGSHAVFISSFEVEPEEDVGLLFDDALADPLLSPSKSQGELHQAVQSLSWLVGRWKSITAIASYPDTKVELCREEMHFLSTMQPTLQYNSESWHAETGEMMYCESGFLNIDLASRTVAFMVTHSLGLSELSEGTLCDKTMLTLSSKSIAHMSFTTNASVTEIVRSFELKGDILTSEVFMATASQPLQIHSVVKYQKVL